MNTKENWEDKHIVFFDGECGICNFWVQWILERDKKNLFMFASLQSEFGQKFLDERGLDKETFNTLYLWKPDHYYLIKSKAVLQIAQLLGGIYQVSILGKIFPVSVKDFMYDLVAKNRMKIANQKCYLPTAEQKRKFIEV